MTAPTLTLDMRAGRISLARRSFWHYLKLKDPNFYHEGRPHLKDFANILQDFCDGKLRNKAGKDPQILITNLPPRLGKSYTLTNFCAWMLGRGKFFDHLRTERAVTVSYNDSMATDFSRFCRDNINAQKGSPDEIVFSDIFPGVKLKPGDSAAKKWALDGEFFSYLGAGFKGELTGKGCTLGVIDDPIKSSEEAYNENTLEFIWNFYKNTFLSRLENGARQIINHTRWRDEDLAGKLINEFPEEVYVYSRSAVENEVIERVPILDDKGQIVRYEQQTTGGDLLCEELLDWPGFLLKQKIMDPETFRANFFQEPLDLTGKMYKYFQTYEYLPEVKGKVESYTDTADEGKDYLCSIVYEIHDKQAYVIDVIYTKDAMEFTEPLLAEVLNFNRVNYSLIESNNGGRGFSRAVEKILLQEYDTNATVMEWFFQSRNKAARILTHSNWCQKNIFFPDNWAHLWPEFFRALAKYTKEGKNKHDDAPDTLTGVAERFAPSGGMPIFNNDVKQASFICQQ